ncbi:hypothetical protein HYX70_04715 [Candidatus Saccharibacteria bacterium]|nr:hypothetical protein [Candidatus Saccharibacteria bacterium]
MEDKPQEQPLPPQASPSDTTNWEDRPFIAPDGRVHIEEFKPQTPDISQSVQNKQDTEQ